MIPHSGNHGRILKIVTKAVDKPPFFRYSLAVIALMYVWHCIDVHRYEESKGVCL